MKLGIFLVLMACCLYLTTAGPIDVDRDEENEDFDNGDSQSESEFELDVDSDDDWLGDVENTEHTENDAMDRISKKPLHELAEILYSDYKVSMSSLIESFEQIENLEITMLKKSTDMYKQICDYVNNTQERDETLYYSGSSFYEVDDIFKVYRHEEVERFEPYERNFNRQLLVHGTRVQNILGILKHGLKIAATKATISGSIFGRGIYFSDSVSKSLDYTGSNNGFPLVLMCEVALGVVDIRYKRDDSKLKEHCDSVQALGENYPHPVHIQPDGLQIPNGMFALRNVTTGIQFNEFVVSDEARVKIRYIVKLKPKY